MSEIAFVVLQGKIFKLEEYFCLNKLNLIGSKTEFIPFSLKNDERLNDLETVTIGSTIVKKSDHCKLRVTIDEHRDYKHKLKPESRLTPDNPDIKMSSRFVAPKSFQMRQKFN